jgi:hypothetical protein
MSDLLKLSEMDRLRMQLSKERQLRMRADAHNLNTAMRVLDAEMSAAKREDDALFANMKDAYQLEPSDEVAADGTIKRAPKPVVVEEKEA